eukprot:7336519-Pyramimonas_sp.AAC.1
MQRSRLQLKKCKYASESHETYFTENYGFDCSSGDPPKTNKQNNSVGLSCRADDTSKEGQTVCAWLSVASR